MAVAPLLPQAQHVSSADSRAVAPIIFFLMCASRVRLYTRGFALGNVAKLVIWESSQVSNLRYQAPLFAAATRSLCATLHLFHRNVFLVSRQVPTVAKG